MDGPGPSAAASTAVMECHVAIVMIAGPCGLPFSGLVDSAVIARFVEYLGTHSRPASPNADPAFAVLMQAPLTRQPFLHYC